MGPHRPHVSDMAYGKFFEPITDAVVEGLAQPVTGKPTNKGGRPKGRRNLRKPGLKSLLGQLPSIEETILKDPGSYDPAVGDKMLALAVRVQWERFLWDENIDVGKKATVGVQIVQHLEGSRSNIWVKDQTKYPGTIADLQKEQTTREANIARLLKYVRPAKPVDEAKSDTKEEKVASGNE